MSYMEKLDALVKTFSDKLSKPSDVIEATEATTKTIGEMKMSKEERKSLYLQPALKQPL